MQVTIIARGARVFGFAVLVTLAVVACAGSVTKVIPDVPVTYTPEIGVVPLPPGVPSDPATFRMLVAARGAGPSHHSARLGKNCGNCTVDVEIGPLGNTMEVDPHPPSTPPLPSSGRVVARILNHDPTNTELLYDLAPMTQKEYYVWADTSGGNARITLLSVPAVSLPGPVQATFQKHLKICLHTHPYPAVSDADFKWCPGITLADKGSFIAASIGYGPLDALVAVLRRALTRETPPPPSLMPIWLECLSGCCG